MPPKPKVVKSPPDRQARAARKAPAGPKPQNSPVLIIFLVFFILLSLVLGVFLYLDKEKVDAANKNAEAKTKEAATALQNQKLEQEYFAPYLRGLIDSSSVTEQEW